MREPAAKNVRLKNTGKKQLHTIQMTEEQITLIRSFQLRTAQLWVNQIAQKHIKEGGEVQSVILWECWFCQRGSYQDAASIPHKKTCIVPLADAEFDQLNAQFIDVLNVKKEEV